MKKHPRKQPKKPRKKLARFSIPENKRNRTSDVILDLIESTRLEVVSLRVMMERLGDRTFGVMLIVMAAFNVIPFVSFFTGVIIIILGLQMSIGMTTAKLPSFILDRQLPRDKASEALRLIEPKVRSIEKFIRPRWRFTEAPILDQVNGLIIVILGIIIMLPIPFSNLGPALAIIIMGLGLLERDGMVQIFALIISLAAIGLAYAFILSTSRMFF